jgi:excisionase family DNA binding protein
MDPFILFIDDELRRHTVRALALGRRELRRNRHYSPKAFEQLIDSLAAQTSLDTPMIDGDDNLPEPELVDQREAARRLGVSERTVNGLVAADELAVIRVGRRVLIDVDEIHGWRMRKQARVG